MQVAERLATQPAVRLRRRLRGRMGRGHPQGLAAARRTGIPTRSANPKCRSPSGATTASTRRRTSTTLIRTGWCVSGPRWPTTHSATRARPPATPAPTTSSWRTCAAPRTWSSAASSTRSSPTTSWCPAPTTGARSRRRSRQAGGMFPELACMLDVEDGPGKWDVTRRPDTARQGLDRQGAELLREQAGREHLPELQGQRQPDRRHHRPRAARREADRPGLPRPEQAAVRAGRASSRSATSTPTRRTHRRSARPT